MIISFADQTHFQRYAINLRALDWQRGAALLSYCAKRGRDYAPITVEDYSAAYDWIAKYRKFTKR